MIFIDCRFFFYTVKRVARSLCHSRASCCMRNCGLRKKNYPRHSVKCDQQCRRQRATAYRTYGARGHPRCLGLSSIGSICHCICYKVGCITYRQEIDQVEFSIIVQICDNNWHFAVCVAANCYQPTLGGQCDMVNFALRDRHTDKQTHNDGIYCT